jgi:hypothetical protein
MRGGKLSGDSSYSTLVSSSSDTSTNLAGQSGDFQQNVDRNNSNISGEGNNVDMSQFKGVVQPGAYTGGRRRRRRMRGGDDMAADDVAPPQEGGRRRRRRMRGGDDGAAMATEDEKTDVTTPPQEGGRRRRRRMRGGDDDMAAMNTDTTPTSGGTRQRRRGGGVIATAALPFGLFGLQKYFQGRKSENGTRRRTRRRRS